MILFDPRLLQTDDFVGIRVDRTDDVFKKCDFSIQTSNVPAEEGDVSFGSVSDENDSEIFVDCQLSIIFVEAFSIKHEVTIFISIGQGILDFIPKLSFN